MASVHATHEYLYKPPYHVIVLPAEERLAMKAEQKRREAEIAVEHAQKRLRDLEADMEKMSEHYAKQVIIRNVPDIFYACFIHVFNSCQ